MKIGVFGPVYVNVKIQVEGEFDELGSNKGFAIAVRRYDGRIIVEWSTLTTRKEWSFYV